MNDLLSMDYDRLQRLSNEIIEWQDSLLPIEDVMHLFYTKIKMTIEREFYLIEEELLARQLWLRHVLVLNLVAI